MTSLNVSLEIFVRFGLKKGWLFDQDPRFQETQRVNNDSLRDHP